MRKVEMIMGMPVSIEISDCKDEKHFSDVFNLLKDIDSQFSPYKPESELSKYRKGVLNQNELSAEMLSVQEACAQYELITDGYFSAYYDGTFEPSGYVKAWAMQKAANLLNSKGFVTFLINVGGDILARSDGHKTWKIALQNPTDKDKITGVINVKNGAIATSGLYQRGSHIVNPHTKRPAIQLLSVTVYGQNIISADIFATTCVAMGKNKALDFMEKQPGYEALVIDRKERAYTTKRFISLKKQIVR